MTAIKRLCASVLLAACGSAFGAATIVIINENAAGVGFNDTTPAVPVGGNPGTTLGQQRLIAFTAAANIWAATITSSVPIRIGASFVPLACDSASAVLGSAGTIDILADFPNAPKPATWYPSALAAKLAGIDQVPSNEPHIRARFNSRLGLFPDCLPGSPFYLGLDDQPGTALDLVTVLIHEMAHGLGFQSFTDEETGQQIEGLPAIWDYFLIDNRIEQLWVNMTDAQRAASAVSGTGLSWNGPIVTAAVPQVLAPQSVLAVTGPAAGTAAGSYTVGDAGFGPPLQLPGVSGQLMPVVDQPDGTGLACMPLSPANAAAVSANIALVDRGTCAFTVKARNLQDAGAKGMVVADNVDEDVTGLGGADPTIVIPAVRISRTDGRALKAALLHRSRTASGVIANLTVDPARLAGTDAQLRIRMYAPTTFSPGSSVSHYTTDAKPNQLMEPFLNNDLTHQVKPPRDLSYPLLQDIGW